MLLPVHATAADSGQTRRAPDGAAQACGNPGAGADYTRGVARALAATRDLWGEALLEAPGGPTYEAARRYLQPLLIARAPHRQNLTDSGVYYVPLADPPGPSGAGAVALHVADGGQIVSRRIGGPSLRILVGRAGTEPYGSCLARLVPARLREGYLPVLETAYTDAGGTRYRQESFATRLPGTRSFASFIGLTAGGRGASGAAVVRLAPSSQTPATMLRVAHGTARAVFAAWVPGGRVRLLDRSTYVAARESLAQRWRDRLSDGATIEVPERRVGDARRALLVQNLILGWRYSIGNAYEEFSFPEGVDLAGVMGEQGFPDVERAILETSLTRSSKGYPNWKRGQRLLGSASHYALFEDRDYVEAVTPALAGYVGELADDLGRSGAPILGRERFSADIPDAVYGLHAQTVAWAGLRAMAGVWGRTGHAELAARAARAAVRLETGLRAAVRGSQRWLPDGSLFVPARLLDVERPYDSVVESRAGSYWNLVTPFALASGFFAPGGAEARGTLAYMLGHGSRLLGLVRAGAYALYGRDAPFPVSGTDQVYGVNVARFLADNDRSDQLVLSLYGQLAAAMTPGTFVAGEGASVAPLDGRRFRAMYLPPNSESNAAFLETLRQILVHETADAEGRPTGLQLAYATPRGWLRSGRRIVVVGAPTSFGPVSFSITAGTASARVRVDVPARSVPERLTLRLRLPDGRRIARVMLAGQPFSGFDRATSTIDVSGRRGRVELDAVFARARS